MCGTELILKKGEIKIHHFAHKRGNDICPFAFEGESETHEAMKKGIKELIERDNKYLKVSELEHIIKDDNGNYMIADYYCETPRGKICVEVVHTHKNIYDFEEKIRFFTKNNIRCMWVFNDDDFSDISKFTSQIHRESHWLNYGYVFTYNTRANILFALHLDKPEYTRWKAKRNVMGLAINNCKLYFAEHSIRGVDGHDLHQLKGSTFC